MIRLINFVFSLIVLSCPWINILIIFCKGISENNKKLAISSLSFLFVELTLFLNLLFFRFGDSMLGVYLFFLIMTILGAHVFSLIVFFKKNDKNGLFYFIVALFSTLTSVFLFLINLISVVVAVYDRKFRYTVLPILSMILMMLLVFNKLPGQFIALIVLLNSTSTVLWLVLTKKNILLNWISSLFANFNSLRLKKIVKASLEKNTVGELDMQDVLLSESSIKYNKGWTEDDTLMLNVNLLTIEDIIFPIMLKNEQEKEVKELISYFRRIQKTSDEDIVSTFGKEGLSVYLRTFFSKLKIEAVRLVYLRSLYLLIEEYSIRDARVKIYLDKIFLYQATLK